MKTTIAMPLLQINTFFNKWGKIKIASALKAKGIDVSLINPALNLLLTMASMKKCYRPC